MGKQHKTYNEIFLSEIYWLNSMCGIVGILNLHVLRTAQKPQFMVEYVKSNLYL